MSYACQNWMKTIRGLSSSEFRVLLWLSDYANEEDLAWPAVTTLAMRCELGERTIQRALGALRAQGVIEVAAAETQHRPITYRLTRDPVARGDKSVRGDTRDAPGVTNQASRGDRSDTRTSSEPLKERTHTTQRARETRAEGGGVSLLEGRVPLPCDWQPDGVTLALAQELVRDRAGVVLAEFRAYYAARPTLLDANWQARAQAWLRRDTKPRAPQGQDGPPRARASRAQGRVAPENKKTQASEELPQNTLEEHIEAWYATKTDADDATNTVAWIYCALARLVVDEETWRGDCERFFAPFVVRLGGAYRYSPMCMVEDAVDWAQRARQAPKSLGFFAGVWDKRSARTVYDRYGDADGFTYRPGQTRAWSPGQ